jgi:hypothetical protein
MSDLKKLVGTPCNLTEGCYNNGGASRPATVKLGKEGSWPQADRRIIDGVKVNNNPGRHGSLLD